MDIHFLIRALGRCQTYTPVSLENEGLYACESLWWVGTPSYWAIGLLV